MQPNLTNLMGNITQSVIEATKAGYIRPSIVHPLTRHNPGDSSGRGVPNYELRYEKDLPYCEIIVSAKGCGAELPNVAKILTPAQSVPLPDLAYNRHLRDYRRCGRSRQSAETVRRRNQ